MIIGIYLKNLQKKKFLFLFYLLFKCLLDF